MNKIYLYLDQRDLIDLSNNINPAIREKLEALLSSKRIRIILSFMHVIETWKYADRTGRRRVSHYADSLLPLWILSRDSLFKEEIKSALWKYLETKTTYNWPSREDENLITGLVKYNDGSYQFSPFRNSIIETIGEKSYLIKNNKNSEISNLPNNFTEMLEAIENNPKIGTMLVEIHQEYPEFVKFWRERAKKLLPGKSDLLRYLVSTCYEDLIIPNEIIDDFLRKFDMKNFPSLYCYLRIKDEINKDKLSTSYSSEMVDIFHITALPYCDAFSTDKRIWDYIRRCGLKQILFENGSTRKMHAFKLLPDAINFIESSG